MCESIKKNAYDDKTSNTLTDFADSSQTIDGQTSLLTRETIVKVLLSDIVADINDSPLLTIDEENV